MSLQQLLDNLDNLIHTPEDIVRVDTTILELAVRGKLITHVSQNSLHLYSLLSYGKDSLPADDQVPFAVPSTWRWLLLIDVADFVVGKTPPTKEPRYWEEGGLPWVSISDMTQYGLVTSTARQVSQVAAEQVLNGKLALRGTLLMSFKLTLGKVSILDLDAYYNEAIVAIYPKPFVAQAFLFRFLPLLVQYGQAKDAIKGATLNSTSLAQLCIPLPPLAEQHRIVAKVDELLAQTRALEANLRRAQEEIVVVNQAALYRLESAEDSANLNAAWNTISGAFDLLYDDPRPLAALRQTILQLAVSGKLVRQDGKDEPAIKLISKIRNEVDLQRTRSVALQALDGPYSLPESWAWTTFDTVAKIATNGVDPSGFGELPHVAPDNIEKGTGRLLAYRSIREDGVTSVKHRFYPGQILYSKIRPNLSKAVLVDFEGLCSADMYPITPYIERRYLHAYMLSGTFRGLTTVSDTRVAMPKINQDALSCVLVPVPPLAEQRRIVAKVDELLGMCNALERQLDRSVAAQKAAVASVLAHLSQQG